jgi:class 3 adenylate cyclase
MIITRWSARRSFGTAVARSTTRATEFLAAFDGPARGIRAACAITDAVRRLGIEVRAGAHTGECEVLGPKLSGVAVHIGARVATLADAGEVLVSQTVKDLVAGSGLRFDDRGVRALKGVPGEWHLHAVDRAAAAPWAPGESGARV